jgi:uncharacterized protein YggE
MDKEETRKILKWTWVALAVLTVFLAAEALGSLRALYDPDPVYNSISVNGQGEVVAVPDVAAFTFTVSADAERVEDAQAEVTRKMDMILDGLESLGIEERDIKTTNYSVWPKYVYEQAVCLKRPSSPDSPSSPISYCPPGRQVADGYTVNHSVSVKVRETDKAGEALALVGENGATGLSNISFTVDDPDEILDEARAQAIERAQDKAERLADELDLRLVRIISFYDNTDSGPRPYYAEEGMGGDMVRNAMSVAPTLPAGENKFVVNVTITYEIR